MKLFKLQKPKNWERYYGHLVCNILTMHAGDKKVFTYAAPHSLDRLKAIAFFITTHLTHVDDSNLYVKYCNLYDRTDAAGKIIPRHLGSVNKAVGVSPRTVTITYELIEDPDAKRYTITCLGWDYLENKKSMEDK